MHDESAVTLTVVISLSIGTIIIFIITLVPDPDFTLSNSVLYLFSIFGLIIQLQDRGWGYSFKNSMFRLLPLLSVDCFFSLLSMYINAFLLQLFLLNIYHTSLFFFSILLFLFLFSFTFRHN